MQARETRLQESATALAAAETALTEAEASLLSAQANLQTALDAFGQAESSGNGATLDTAWAGVSNALFQWTTAKESYDSSDSEFDDAQKDWQKNSIGLEQYKNDYEAQSSPFAIRDDIARCRTAECSADSFLDDERFTVFQPNVLEMVGAHYAYAKGLTGKEIRIGIEDDAANYTLPEFAGRVSFAGATVLYPVYDGDDFLSDASLCQRTGLNCRLITYSSEHADLETLTARWIIAKHGWPADGERWFIRNDYHEAGSLGSLLGLRWREIPDATSLSHGTTVASVAAGRDFGIAPGATVVPIFKDFRYRNQAAERHVLQSLLYVIDNLSKSNRDIVDQALAIDVAYEYANFDIINRSYGIGVFDPVAVSELLNDETQWWGEGLRQILPRTWRAYMQTETHPDDRTILVYAAGNELQEFSGLGADIPYYVPHVRGSQLSVMAVDHDGSHTSYTNFCGAVPPDWDPERWGRHFCLAAPGTVNSAGSGGQGFIVHEAGGTSFAAPVVTGAIALLMEHFRGQLGATEIVKRVVNTANNRGRYAQIEIYGAGLLDLEAALQPVGTVMTGTPSEKTSTLSTVFQVPAAMGSLGRRLAGRGVEVASLDALGAPFWSSPERLLRQTAYQSVIPKFTDPEWTPHRGFTPRVSAGPVVKGFQTLLS
ncbi:MAG: S8 family serine peptidase [Deltaproteobacteria bacterium]|nr:S8 family serine peptidase [Deltaproteobacteria bacterium]